MIINFSVTNFRSIKDKVQIDFNASKDKEHYNFVTDTKYCSVLNATAIYGVNASGKSNLIRAMQVMSLLLYFSATDDHQLLQKEIIPFAFDNDNAKAESTFNINFIYDNTRYEYGFSADNNRIYNEWLYAYPNKKAQLLFTRVWINDIYEYKFGVNYKGEKKKFENITKPTALFLSVAKSFDKQETAQKITQWFFNYFILYSSTMHNNVAFEKAKTVEFIQRDSSSRGDIIKFLTESDFSIVNFDIKEDENMDHDWLDPIKEFISVEKLKNIKKEPVILTDHNVNGKTYHLQLSDESSGTQRIFNVAPLIIMTLKNGGVLVIDELNNYLHPLLVKHIVGLFGNPQINTKQAQLIFTTHETSIMTTDFIRRDQIWFCDKSTEQATVLYSAQEFSPRKTDNLEKAYLSGRYGAIPILMD